MSSIDILHPLTGDYVAGNPLSVLIAWDLTAFGVRTAVTLTCTVSGTSSPPAQTANIFTGSFGEQPFSFNIATDGNYTINASTALYGSDQEGPVHVSNTPPLTMHNPGPPVQNTYPVTGTTTSPTTDTVTVTPYALVPSQHVMAAKPRGCLFGWLSFLGARSRPKSWQAVGSGVPVHPDANHNWSAQVLVHPGNFKHLRFTAVRGDGKKTSRGRPK
jgi:hypothetical protein